MARFTGLWDKRLAGVPVQHLIGEWDFYGRPFRVDGRALVPRPETEILLEQALKEAPDARRVLDAGTGSGIIAITYLLEQPQARAVALDISLDALALARENAARHGVLDRLALVASDWLSALAAAPFDVILSNPPYLAVGESPHLPPTVRDHDPRRALFAGDDGLDGDPAAAGDRGRLHGAGRTARLRDRLRPGRGGPLRDPEPAGLALPADRAGPRGHSPHLPRAARVLGGESQ